MTLITTRSVFRRPFGTRLRSLTTSQHTYSRILNTLFRTYPVSQVDMYSSTNIAPSATLKTVNRLDPCNHTGGYWLHQHDSQYAGRYIQFDFTALCRHVVKVCPGANTVVLCEKLDGGFNRVFKLTLDNGVAVIARLPTPVAGPSKLVTNSEVATMIFLREHTKVPVPKVIDWNDDARNPVGAEYIIMECIQGVRLQDCWDSMNIVQHLECTTQLGKMVAETANIPFNAYGSVYFTNFEASNVPIAGFEKYSIGPHCGSVYWNCGPGEKELYTRSNERCGPWITFDDYCQGLMESALARIPVSSPEARLSHYGSLEELRDLVKQCRPLFKSLCQSKQIKNAAKPTLLHPDLHKRNVFVSSEDPTVITGIIDWQSTSVEPALLYGLEQPDFAAFPEGNLFQPQLPQDYEGQHKHDDDALLCFQAYDACIKGYAPSLLNACKLDESVIRLFNYYQIAWRIGATAIRQELIDLAQSWGQLDLPCACPYSPTKDELEEHRQLTVEFEDAQNLKAAVMQVLDVGPHGWVQEERREEVEAIHDKFYQTWMESAAEMHGTGEEDITAERARLMWPFDSKRST